jgi:hypothetical protein
LRFLAPGQYKIDFSGFSGNSTGTVFSASYNNFNGTINFYSTPLHISSEGNASVSINVPDYMMNVHFSLSSAGSSNSTLKMNLLQTSPG